MTEPKRISPEMNFAKLNIYTFFAGSGGPVWGAFTAYYGPLMALLVCLGASAFYNGVVNALFWLGFILTQIPAAYYSERLRLKKKATGVIFILAGACTLLFGLILLLTGGGNLKLMLGAFIVCYGLTTIISGAATPLIFTIIFKIVPPPKLGSWLGVYFMVTAVAGIIGGFAVSRIIPLGYPVAYEVLFIATFVFAVFMAVAVWMVNEPEGELAPRKENFGVYMGHLLNILKSDKNLVRFFIGMWLAVGHYIVLTFYSAYAVKEIGIAQAETGNFVSMNLIGYTLASLGPFFFVLFPLGWIMKLRGSKLPFQSNILSAGWIADKYGPRQTLILFQIVALIGVVLVLFAKSAFLFYFVWVFAGFAQICNNIGYSNMGLLSCPIQDKSSYIGLVNVSVFPFVVVVPMIIGALIEKGFLTYIGSFVISMVLMVITMLYFVFFVDNPAEFKRMKAEK